MKPFNRLNRLNTRTAWVGALSACVAALALFGCAPERVAGTTSETTNGFTATVTDQDGRAVAFARIRVRPRDFLSDTSNAEVERDSTLAVNLAADSSGRFTVRHLKAGEYAIEIKDGKGSGSLVRARSDNAGIVDLGVTVVKPMGGIEGAIEPSILGSARKVYVLVRGLERSTAADPGTGRFTLSGLPQGNYALRFIAAQPAYAPLEVENVEVVSGGTTAMGTLRLNPFAAWRFSRKVILNTGPSGADIPGTVHGFPVLIRLDTGNFDFSKAQADGTDLRFASADSVPLPHEIERWDPVLRRAEIWVRVDSVRGNDSAQSMRMFWGQPGASPGSIATLPVFDTANGFLGVWHLQDKAGQPVRDASAHARSGTSYGAADTDGIIGMAKRFSTKDSIVIPGLLGSPKSLSLSAWVDFDPLTTGSYGGDAVSVGNAALIRIDEKSAGVMGGFHAADTNFMVTGSDRYLANTGWHHVAFTFDGVNHIQTLFIDGVAVKTQSSATPINYAGVGKNTVIGAHGGGAPSLNYSGAIDEVRASARPLPADWIKLSYRNQGREDKLVVFSGAAVERAQAP